MRIASTDGARLAVHEAGPPGAPTVILVHGYPDSSAVWADVAAELSARFHVVRFDVRGAGASDRPSAQTAYRLDQLAADLGAVAEAVSPDRPVHLVGHDWGSIQCWHALRDKPFARRVASFTSISGPDLDQAGTWLRSGFRPGGARLRDVVRQLFASNYLLWFNLPVLPELLWRNGLLDRIMAASTRVGRGSRPARTTWPQSMADKINGLQLYRANMMRRLGRPHPVPIEVPVQVIVPRADVFASAPLQTGAPRPWVRDLRIRSVAGGHWVVATRPDVVARLVSELADHTSGRRRAPGPG